MLGVVLRGRDKEVNDPPRVLGVLLRAVLCERLEVTFGPVDEPS
jgi:hypothetical protein